uniref:Uncharacterized protein n=1 Tax=Bionectria ochroleuca TaxID=29856 RepID=A0A8H7NHL7_BIOOC
MSGNVRGVPSWVPDFTRPRMIREGEEAPLPHKKKTEFWHSAAHILDRVLFMEGLLLDEIIHVFPLPHNDPFLLLQQLWYVERSFGEPRYLRDKAVKYESESSKPKDEFEDMIDRLGGVTIYPSIAWATDDANRFIVDISIVDMINGLTNLGPLLLEPLESYMKKIPKVVDTIMEKEQPGSHDLTSNGASSSPSRDDLIDEMESRFLKFTRLVASRATWKDLVGICTFDYENFRSQILHRLIMWSAQRVADLLGDRPGREYLKDDLGPREETTRHAITHTPILYKEYIDAIEDCHDILEMRLREGFIIDLAARIHKTTADMVGLKGDRVLDNDDAKGKHTTEMSCRLVCMFPLLRSDDRKKRQADQIREYSSSLDLPHDKPGHPFGEMSRWYTKPRQGIYDTHLSLHDVVDFLAGRELFVTETGLVGITGVGTTGIQDGDDLLLLEGMSYPLIGRLEPLPELGTPKKRRREMPTKMMKREILGTAVVKGIDPKDGKLENATMPSWFEDITRGSRGLFRFS